MHCTSERGPGPVQAAGQRLTAQAQLVAAPQQDQTPRGLLQSCEDVHLPQRGRGACSAQPCCQTEANCTSPVSGSFLLQQTVLRVQQGQTLQPSVQPRWQALLLMLPEKQC